MSTKMPAFFVTKTLLGFPPGEDRNRLTLVMPGEREFVLLEMGEPRTPEIVACFNALAVELTALWEVRGEPTPPAG